MSRLGSPSPQEKVIVTGGAGYIGSVVAHKLHALGYDVTILDNLSTGDIRNVGSLRLIKMDLGDKESLFELFKKEDFQTCFHFAASTNAPESVGKPLFYFQNNTVNSLNLLQACQSSGVKRFILSSTAAVYGQQEASTMIDEEAPLAPINPYGLSKLQAEQILQNSFNCNDQNFLIFRYFNVAGASQNLNIGPRSQKSYPLIRIAAQCATGQRPSIQIYGTDFPTTDGTGIRDYIHIEDLAELHVLGLSYLKEQKTSQVFNCGYSTETSVKQVIDIAKRLGTQDFEVIETTPRPGDPYYSLANANKASQLLKWKPQFNNLETIIQSSIDWEQKLLLEQ